MLWAGSPLFGLGWIIEIIEITMYTINAPSKIPIIVPPNLSIWLITGTFVKIFSTNFKTNKIIVTKT